MNTFDLRDFNEALKYLNDYLADTTTEGAAFKEFNDYLTTQTYTEVYDEQSFDFSKLKTNTKKVSSFINAIINANQVVNFDKNTVKFCENIINEIVKDDDITLALDDDTSNIVLNLAGLTENTISEKDYKIEKPHPTLKKISKEAALVGGIGFGAGAIGTLTAIGATAGSHMFSTGSAAVNAVSTLGFSVLVGGVVGFAAWQATKLVVRAIHRVKKSDLNKIADLRVEDLKDLSEFASFEDYLNHLNTLKTSKDLNILRKLDKALEQEGKVSDKNKFFSLTRKFNRDRWHGIYDFRNVLIEKVKELNAKAKSETNPIFNTIVGDRYTEEQKNTAIEKLKESINNGIIILNKDETGLEQYTSQDIEDKKTDINALKEMFKYKEIVSKEAAPFIYFKNVIDTYAKEDTRRRLKEKFTRDAVQGKNTTVNNEDIHTKRRYDTRKEAKNTKNVKERSLDFANGLITELNQKYADLKPKLTTREVEDTAPVAVVAPEEVEDTDSVAVVEPEEVEDTEITTIITVDRELVEKIVDKYKENSKDTHEKTTSERDVSSVIDKLSDGYNYKGSRKVGDKTLTSEERNEKINEIIERINNKDSLDTVTNDYKDYLTSYQQDVINAIIDVLEENSLTLSDLGINGIGSTDEYTT